METRRAADLRPKIPDFRGFDSSRILSLRGGVPRPTGDFPGSVEPANLCLENLSREIGRSCVSNLPTKHQEFGGGF